MPVRTFDLLSVTNLLDSVLWYWLTSICFHFVVEAPQSAPPQVAVAVRQDASFDLQFLC